jgi:hypothetical protein
MRVRPWAPFAPAFWREWADQHRIGARDLVFLLREIKILRKHKVPPAYSHPKRATPARLGTPGTRALKKTRARFTRDDDP